MAIQDSFEDCVWLDSAPSVVYNRQTDRYYWEKVDLGVMLNDKSTPYLTRFRVAKMLRALASKLGHWHTVRWLVREYPNILHVN